ncbi:MAG: adenylate/guanylate cyclase domain-containing protein, partial [Tepidiformaceae bacterium]
GDGMMVFFNDPIPCDEPAWRAVQLAVGMQARAGGLAEAWKRQGHHLRLGVGIDRGYATCGQIGFEGRYEYTAIGTVTNLASRLCAEAVGGQTLVSERVFALIEDRVHAEPAGDLVLKGLARPVTTYSVTGLRHP